MGENNGHCWHPVGHNTGPDQSEICCFCGYQHDPTKRLAVAGHGKFAPKNLCPTKPEGVCFGRKAFGPDLYREG